MKRIRPGKFLLSVFLLFAVSLSFCACGESTPDVTETEKPGTSADKQTETETNACLY